MRLIPIPTATQRDAIHNHACAVFVLDHPERFPNANRPMLRQERGALERQILSGDREVAHLYLTGNAIYDRHRCQLYVPGEAEAMA